MIELPCPAWCETDHAALIEDDLRTHQHNIREIPTTDGRSILVEVAVTDDMTAGTRGPAAVCMWGSGHGDELTAGQSCQLAAALLDGADFLEGLRLKAQPR